MRQEYPSLRTEGLSEAEIFQGYLSAVYGLQADHLETESTNCGNNITNLLALLKEKGILFRSIILCQDVSMQRRMEAGLRKYVSDEVRIIRAANNGGFLWSTYGTIIYDDGGSPGLFLSQSSPAQFLSLSVCEGGSHV